MALVAGIVMGIEQAFIVLNIYENHWWKLPYTGKLWNNYAHPTSVRRRSLLPRGTSGKMDTNTRGA